VLAGVDVDAVAVAAGAANRKVPDEDVLAVGGMNGPHQAVRGGEILQPDVLAAERLDQRRVAQRVLRVGASAESGVASDPAGPYYADVIGIHRVDEADPPLDPFPLPPHLHHRIVVEVRRPEDVGVLFQAENRVGPQGNGPCEIVAGGNHGFAAAQDPTAIESLLNRGGVLGRSVASGA
jgi:hypothetical protein